MTNSPINDESAYIRKELLYVRLLSFIDSISGFVHNVSNPLTVVATKSQLFQLKMPQNSDFSKMVDQSKVIESMLNNIVMITESLKDQGIRHFDLNALLKNEFEYYNTDAFFKHKIDKVYGWSRHLPRIKFSYFDVSMIIFCIMQILLAKFPEIDDKRMVVKTGNSESSVTVQITANCLPFDEKTAQAISAADTDSLPASDKLFRDLSDAVRNGATSGLSLDIGLAQNQTAFTINIPINKYAQ